MSSVFLDISAALNSQLNTLDGKPPIAWENYPYTPTVGTLYARPTLLPGDTAGATVGSKAVGGKDEHIGVYTIDVFAPSDSGRNAAFVMADKIADQFKPVTELKYNGVTVRCDTVSIGAASQSSGWYMVPIRIRYIAYTAKR
jgi:hypothetical protein